MSRYVLLPAFPLDSRIWNNVVDLLQSAGHEVLTPDIGGLGTSDIPAVAPSVDAMASQVAAAIDSAGWTSAHVGGISMGGYVAMATLRMYPERVDGLGLVCTKASMDSPAKRLERLQQATDMDSAALAVMARSMSIALVGTNKVMSEHVCEWIQEQSPAAVAWCLRAMAARPDSLGVLRTAGSRRVAVVSGEDDVIATEQDVHHITAALADARAKVSSVRLPGVGHLAVLEDPRSVADALLTLSA